MTRAVCCKYAADNPLLRRCYSPFSRCYCSLFLEEKGNEFMLLEGMGTLESLERRGAASTAGDRRAVRSIGVKRGAAGCKSAANAANKPIAVSTRAGDRWESRD